MYSTHRQPATTMPTEPLIFPTLAARLERERARAVRASHHALYNGGQSRRRQARSFLRLASDCSEACDLGGAA